MEEHSLMFDFFRGMYRMKRITAEKLLTAVPKCITQEEYEEIISE